MLRPGSASDEGPRSIRLEDILSPARWACKKERLTCGDCRLKFSNLFRRRHHCRLCGELFCKQCVLLRELQVPAQGKQFVKVCKTCFLDDARTANSSSSCESPKRPHSVKSMWGIFSNDIAAISTPTFDYERRSVLDMTTRTPPSVDRNSEKRRLDVLRAYHIDYTAPDDTLQSICMKAARALKCPIAYVAFMEEDTLWIKSSVGFNLHSIPRDQSITAHVVQTREPLIVTDTFIDGRFHDTSLVIDHAIRFYAGVPIANKNGWVLGALVVLDYEQHVEKIDVRQLTTLAEATMDNLRKPRSISRQRTISHDSSKPRASVLLLDADFVVDATDRNSEVGLRLTSSDRSGLSESTLMDLLAQSTNTQRSLAQHNTHLATTLGTHSEKLDQLTQAISRMESKLRDAA
ncbi:unnamed protein product [Aphanomyces euteiches]|uniref:FYVE-type domain-containing protein n=1 Tax=Aphanomyces euteiches TaxID=100861 RepID=A0A6G0XW23_9STRA|nr:hypothetical protein Ae201684_001110 [Aphanomyces euteiches]KAH9099681.1 hypothetical protein Ae201684P_018694 [Aphanomyces euteiches]KAH9152095.1 hypothetical protein AeRB84_005427 [Aphanomyces euteiches]